MTQNATFLPPVIRDRNGNLDAYWYVEFSFLNPGTGKLQRFRYYCPTNLPTAKERYASLKKILDHWNAKIFVEGYNPFGETRPIDRAKFSIHMALIEIINEKKTYQQQTSFRDSSSRINIFIEWLQRQQLSRKKPKEITKGHISDFLRFLSTTQGVSNRTRNNYLIELRSCFHKMKALEMFPDTITNPCEAISRVPSRSQRHILYTKTEMKRMQHWMEQHDPNLLLFTRHIIMGLRPIEIVKLRVSQYDTEDWFIKVWAEDEKTGSYKRKIILQQYREQLGSMNLWQYPGQYFMFTSKGVPGPVATTRDYFSDRFKKMKDELGFGPMHTMYGLRHTTIVGLVKAGMNHIEIMKYSGHKTLDAFQAYIQQYLDDDNIPDVGKSLQFVL